MQVVISHAENEIHVSVPFALKERAKKIKGYRWSPALKVWTYPYNQPTFSELVAEFGDDATVKGFEAQPRSRLSEPTIAEGLQSKIKEQETQLAASTARIETLLREQGLFSRQVQDLNQQLEQKNTEVESAKKLIDSLKAASEDQKLKQSIEFWKGAAEENEKKYQEAAKQLREKVAPQPLRSPLRVSDPFVQVVQRAIALARNDGDFQQTVNGSTLSRVALDLATGAEKKLRKILVDSVLAAERNDFRSLIQQASDKQLISDEARGLLNFVRQNRNRVAHDQLERPVIWARSCLAVLASAIVWPEMDRR